MRARLVYICECLALLDSEYCAVNRYRAARQRLEAMRTNIVYNRGFPDPPGICSAEHNEVVSFRAKSRNLCPKGKNAKHSMGRQPHNSCVQNIGANISPRRFALVEMTLFLQVDLFKNNA